MKTRFLALLLLGTLSVSTSYASGSHSGSSHQKEEFSVGSGIINSINKSKRTINISHGEIPSLKWPKMTIFGLFWAILGDIDFGSLKEGQSIKFKIKLDHDNIYRIFKIKINK